MKGNSHIKAQITLAAFALSLVALNAAEQRALQTENLSLHPQEPIAALAPSVWLTKKEMFDQFLQGVDADDKRYVIDALGKVNSDQYTESFINTVEALSQGMEAFAKSNVIEAVGKVDSDHYRNFIDTVNALSQGMDAHDKRFVIGSLGKLNPDRYTEPFINTVKALLQGMDGHNKWYVIDAVGCVNRYTEPFINTVNALSEGMDAFNKSDVICAVGCVNPDRYTESFINTFDVLSRGMDLRNKRSIIYALGCVNPDHYKEFINTVNALSQGMNIDKSDVIRELGCVNPDRYTELFINIVNALSQGMDLRNKRNVIQAVGKVNPDRYKEFINTVNELSQGMDASNKSNVIGAVGCVNPDHYTDFIKTVNTLSQGMDLRDKTNVIRALGNVNPDRYTDFINTVNALSQGMNASNKSNVIGALGKVHPDLYTKPFINTVNALSQGMDAFNKSYIICVLGWVNPDHYPFLQNFIRQNPRYFSYVPVNKFPVSMKSNMTQQELQARLERLHREYYNDAPAGIPQGLAFEIHTFANQEVVGQTGEKQRFNGAVLNHLQRSIQGDVLAYDVVLDLLRAELATLKSDPLKSNAIDEAVYNWVIQINKDPQAQKTITTVVTYLEQKDNTHGKLRTWLYAFMDESKKAYDGRNSESCIMGVKERVITSLRSAIPEGDTALENLFHQAEAPLMLAAKSAKLTDHAFWAQQLKQKGVTSATHKDIAKDKFKEALVEFFAADKGAQEIIDATLDSFDDSDNASDGFWSKIKKSLNKKRHRM